MPYPHLAYKLDGFISGLGRYTRVLVHPRAYKAVIDQHGNMSKQRPQ